MGTSPDPGADGSSILHVRLLGGFGLEFEGRPVTTVDAPRLQSLLAHLILHRDERVPRERLAYLFWPDSEESQARTNLRQALHLLRRALPDSERFLETESRAVRWRDDAPVEFDVAEFERLAAGTGRESLEGAVGLYSGALLPDCYDDWIIPERDRMHEAFLAAAERLAELLEHDRDYRTAIPWARRLLDEDPLDEGSCQRLMRLHALAGDRAGALRVYHGFATALARETGVEPGPATREAYERLLEPTEEQASKPSAPGTGAWPLVGRSEEWEALRGAFRRAAAGEALLAVVAGEAGIGKSRLCEELLDWVGRQGVAAAGSRCYAAAGELAYAPLVELLRSDALGPGLRRLGDPWLAELARLLPELVAERPELPSPAPLTDDLERARLLDALSRAVLAVGAPLLLAIDDLQWCDGETLGWLHYMLRSSPRAPLLVVATARSEELGADNPAQPLLMAARGSGQAVELELGPLDPADTAALARNVAGHDLDEERRQVVHRETEGNPLFVVEWTRAGLSDGEPGELPPRAHSVIEARLAQLSQPAQELASLAATVGRAFTFAVLANASSRGEEQVVEALDELWERRIVRERGLDAYDFSHDKLREAAYLRAGSARRRMLHGRVAQALERLHGSDLDGVSGQLAAHYERAGWSERAIGYYARAAEVAQRVFAYETAIDLFSKALVLLEGEPASRQRDERELALRAALGAPLAAVKGYGADEVYTQCQRALELCERLGSRPDPPVLRALAIGNVARGNLVRTYELGEQLLEIGEHEDDQMVRVEGNYVLGVASFWFGHFAAARDQFERAIAEYVPERARAHLALYSQDPRIVCMSRLAFALRYLGEVAEAEEMARETLRLADELAHPLSLGYALNFATWLAIELGDDETARERAERMLALTGEHQLGYFQPMEAILRGWMLAAEGRVDQGVALIREGLDEYTRSGWNLPQPYCLVLLARVCLDHGRTNDARAAVDEAFSLVERTGQRCFEAQLHLLMGELEPVKAESHFSAALEVARRQGAAPLAQRAAESLGRLRAAAG